GGDALYREAAHREQLREAGRGPPYRGNRASERTAAPVGIASRSAESGSYTPNYTPKDSPFGRGRLPREIAQWQQQATRLPLAKHLTGRHHMIELKNLSKRYGDTSAVDDLTFTVVPGRVTGFLGPN